MRLVEQDANLDVRHIVAVQHDVAAAPVDPARPQAVPHLAQQLPPQPGELRPRGRGGDHGGPVGLRLDQAHLVVHAIIIGPRCRAVH